MTQNPKIEACALRTDCPDRASTRLSIKHALFVLGDATQAHGARYKGQPAVTSAVCPAPLPATEAAAHEVLSLPLWPGMTADQIDEVAAAIWEAAEAAPNPATDGRAETS